MTTVATDGVLHWERLTWCEVAALRQRVREWLTNLINQQPDLAVLGEAETGPQATEAMLRLRPDVAIIDISLKDSSGIELIKNLKQTLPNIAVLVLSMHEESHYAERALRAGARGYIVKRETTRKVILAIRQVLAGQPYLSEQIATALATQYVTGKGILKESPVEQLSDRELEVFRLIGEGHGTRQIAEELHLSVKTVESYQAHIKEKLSLRSARELMQHAIQWNMNEKTA
jgi:DNA-binding NarL/FixJ family response regulator